MKKLILIGGGTYFAIRHWDKLSNRDKKRIKTQARGLVSKGSAKAAEELTKYRSKMAARK